MAEAGQLQQGWFPVSSRWCCCEDSLFQTQLAELCRGKPKATGALTQAESHWDSNLFSSWLEGYSGDRGSCSSLLHWGKNKENIGMVWFFQAIIFPLFSLPTDFPFPGENDSPFLSNQTFASARISCRMEVLCFNQLSAETFQAKASAVCLVSLVTCHVHPGRKDKGLTQLRQFFKLSPSLAFREVRNGCLHPGRQ